MPFLSTTQQSPERNNMLKQMIQWKGFDGRPASQTLYFNLTKFEIAGEMELEVLQDRFQRFQTEVIQDGSRDMTPPEIREMLDMIKTIIKYAYGVRSHEGRGFSKSPEIWQEFVDTGAFDAFIWYLFEEPNRANAFMTGIWPEEYQNAVAKGNLTVVDENYTPVQENPTATDDGIPSLEDGGVPEKTSWTEYSEQELLDLPDVSFQKIVARATNGKNVPYQLLVIGGKRMEKDRGADGPDEG
jgi:hypothetical protein